MKWRRSAKSASSSDGPAPSPGRAPDSDTATWELQRRVAELSSEAQVLMITGLSADAVPLQQEARRLMYVLVGRDPGDRDAKRMLGSVLYGLGSTLVSAEQPDGSLEALTECAGVYGELRELGEPDM